MEAFVVEGAQLGYLILFQGPQIASPQEVVDRDGQVQLTTDIEWDAAAVLKNATAEGVEIRCCSSNSCFNVDVFY